MIDDLVTAVLALNIEFLAELFGQLGSARGHVSLD